ncbi:short-chain oxidoreductase [Blastomyces dermatitidis ER-3]|uniref:Short-chain oxidoreductase n=3 Tax=Blastomyces TaxID=229219 RepID=A0A179UT18_BLAGS|nr:short-chain oxidoreductase [Blastomyces gilchristii SLH14081]XP_045277215.1 short-chain oxidoreductase [Blastomyces dermatitidis ER-3]EGE86229.1 short-chain oxidoreductase [Blastomyces dermatitidis ATCC 18188]EQL34298.1 hypothetical protein BDFG_03824 [Blastomyces dermatitidis ATCC 26199]EEQ90489.1 short-chain oxidoreductase [Blastomyces dermatitidis ER-3]OAT10181.1 short-chain oxidoreductase [Blastomyces gilchristii SLH14081]
MSQMVWLVTGCSSRFGYEFVLELLARGERVIATARKVQKLATLEEAGAKILRLDLADSELQIMTAVKAAIDIYRTIDVLVNNAGYLEAGVFEGLSDEKFTCQFRTNVFGTSNVTRSILPHFRSRRAGTIVVIGSVAGWQGTLGGSAYNSSKSAVAGMFEALQQETAHLGIRSLLVEPGLFRTQVFSPTNVCKNVCPISDYTTATTMMDEFLAATAGNEPGDPQKAVKVIIDVVTNKGVGKDREFPARLPLGRDALEIIRKKCSDTLALLDRWEEVVVSTDISM